MNDILEKIFETQKFTNSKNQIINIHSETRKNQCDFLQDIIKNNKFKHSIEIGFAYGMSTLAITEEIVKNGGSHVVIDKFQNTGWGGNGLDLITQAGYSEKVEFYEEYCYITLPALLEKGRKFDFAYIDSTKQLDWLLVDFFYLDKLLEINGIIVFDDVIFPGIRKLLRYLCQFPNYKVYAQFPTNYNESKSKKLAKSLKLLPYSEKLLKEEILRTDFELGINAHAIALQKIDTDKRNWDWHVNF
ncbi:MAG TPA: class I SAM-dependent methyltransferase [Ferruginibacter sp.]|nr:class I SAM-dependent methyltransferase [Ferruginibacter sp.]